MGALEDRVRFKLTEPPGSAVDDESVKFGWAQMPLLSSNRMAGMKLSCFATFQIIMIANCPKIVLVLET